MAENLELSFYCDAPFELERLFRQINDAFGPLTTEEIKSIDSWAYDNETSIDFKDIGKRAEKSIVLMDFTLSQDRGGLFLFKESGKYVYDFWIDTERYERIRTEKMHERLIPLYEKALLLAHSMCSCHKNVCCFMGLETVVKVGNSIKESINELHNVDCILFSSEETVSPQYPTYVFNAYKLLFLNKDASYQQVIADLLKRIEK